MSQNEILIALLAASGPVLTALLAWFAQRRKARADASSVVTTSALNILEQWQARAVYLEGRVAVLETQLKGYGALKTGARRLAAQVVSMGGEPVYRPPEDNGQ
jgi:hypothetical protein